MHPIERHGSSISGPQPIGISNPSIGRTMKKSLVVAGILILLTAVVCIDRIASPAGRLRRTLPKPIDTELPTTASGSHQANAPRDQDRERIAAAVNASFSPENPPAEVQTKPSTSPKPESPEAEPRSPSGVRSAPSSGAVLPMELVIDTINTDPGLQSTFSNKSPLLLAIRYDGELFKLDRWMSKTLDVTADDATLDVFIWGIINGREQWQAVYSTLVNPRPGNVRLPLESNHGPPIKPAAPPPSDDGP